MYLAESLIVIPSLQGAINSQGKSVGSWPAPPSCLPPALPSPILQAASTQIGLMCLMGSGSFCQKKFCFFPKDTYSNRGFPLSLSNKAGEESVATVIKQATCHGSKGAAEMDGETEVTAGLAMLPLGSGVDTGEKTASGHLPGASRNFSVRRSATSQKE